MCGGFCVASTGVVSARWAGPPSATNRPSSGGSVGDGRKKKKSAPAAANDSVCGRKRFERATAPGSHLGSARPDARAPILLQLEVPFGDGGYHHLEFLFPALSGQHQGP